MRNSQLNNNRLGLVEVWPINSGQRLSSNFTVEEFQDDWDHPANHFVLVSPSLVNCLQRIRDVVAQPMTILSGFRTEAKNTAIGGAANSYHTLGLAADSTCQNMPIYTMMNIIQKMLNENQLPEIGGVGYYPDRHFIHLDVRPKVDGEVIYWAEAKKEKQQA